MCVLSLLCFRVKTVKNLYLLFLNTSTVPPIPPLYVQYYTSLTNPYISLS